MRTGVMGQGKAPAGAARRRSLAIRGAIEELSPASIEQVARRVAELLRQERPRSGDGVEEGERPGGPLSGAGPAPSGLVDASTLARRLGLTRTWVYEHANELGAISLGDGERPRLRFDANFAEAALARRRRTGQPPGAPIRSVEPIRPRRRRPPRSESVELLPIRGAGLRGIMAGMRRERRRWR